MNPSVNQPESDFETIEFNVSNGLAILKLNRPDRLNSFTTKMHTEVRAALKQVKQRDDVRCLLLTGNGRGFCAGQDLNDRSVSVSDEAPDLSASIEKNYNPLIRTLTSLELPVICAVNGVAAGAGANIAFACDIVFAAKSASFIQSFNKLGLVPDSGGTWILPRLVGHAKAMAMCLLGEKISADQALRIGLIYSVVDDDELLTEAINVGSRLANGPTKGLSLIKRAIHASATSTLDQQLDLERDLQGIAGKTNDYREGVAAFIEKRQPEYQGN